MPVAAAAEALRNKLFCWMLPRTDCSARNLPTASSGYPRRESLARSVTGTLAWMGAGGSEVAWRAPTGGTVRISSIVYMSLAWQYGGDYTDSTIELNEAIHCRPQVAVATVTMRYIEQEIAIIKAKFVGEKRTEERIPRGIGSARPAPARTPQNEKSPAAVKQNAVRPPGSGVGQSQPAAAVKAPAARTVITTTAVVPGKNVPVADAVREASRAVPVEEVTTPLEPEPATARWCRHPPRTVSSTVSK